MTSITNPIELMTALNSLPIEDWAATATDSGIAGAKDVYLAMGKSHEIPAKQLEEWWKEAQPIKAKGGAKGFADVYYDWLAEEAREEQQAADYINGHGEYGETTKNVKAHFTHYLNIWALAESVRSGHRVVRTLTAKGSVVSRGTKVKKVVTEQLVEPDEVNNPMEDVDAEPKPFDLLVELLRDAVEGNKPNKTIVRDSALSIAGRSEATLTDKQLADEIADITKEKGKLPELKPAFAKLLAELK